MATPISSLSIVDAKFVPLSDSNAKGGQYTVWSKNCNSYFPAFGQAGKALSNGVRNEPSFPRQDDCVKDEHGLDIRRSKNMITTHLLMSSVILLLSNLLVMVEKTSSNMFTSILLFWLLTVLVIMPWPRSFFYT